MAQATQTFSTFDAVGIREDLADVIYDVSPVETPFLSMVPHVDATSINHEWQIDSLAAAASNAQVQGDALDADASTATTRVGNRTQIAWKIARVTGTQRAVNTAGRADELDYQMLKRARELRRDMETDLLANNAKVTGNDTTAAELGGIGAWITTNDVFASDGGSPTSADGSDARTDGTQRAFTEDDVKTSLKLIFDSGGMPDVLMTGGFNRQIASSFSAGRTNVQKVEDSTLHASFDVYDSDFGTLRIIPNRFQRARDALILQTDMWAVAFLPGRNMATEEIAKTHDSDSRAIISEFTLEARNEAASGGVFDLTTT